VSIWRSTEFAQLTADFASRVFAVGNADGAGAVAGAAAGAGASA
jgi:hypothetical protein